MAKRPHHWHGLTKTPTHRTWSSMKDRCLNPKCYSYQDYGGRGIRVCQRWLDSFPMFLEDMGIRPEGKTLDRRDVNGNYTPENCRWATPEEQSNNVRSNILLEFQGKTQSLALWAREMGLTRAAIQYRLHRGWSMERTLTTPKNLRTGRIPALIEFRGEKLSLGDWATKLQIPWDCLQRRILYYKWTIEKAFTTPVDRSRWSTAKRLENRPSIIHYADK